MSGHYEPKTALGRVVNEIEETAIAVLLGLMTVITFINVVLRYVFNTGLIWGLEAVTFLFAWLVLFGVSYAVKVTAHLGVDAVINLFSPPMRRVRANFANLPQTEGRWFPLGFEEMKRTSYRGWYEVVDIPFPEWLRWIEPIMNEGEHYEKIPRFIPYFILPFGMALLLFRVIQATVRIATGEATSLIVSHEAEDAVEEVAHLNKD